MNEPLPAGLRIGFSPDLGYAVVQSDVAAAVEDATGVTGSGIASSAWRAVPEAGRT